ncbi:M1 family metallopeptidase [Pilimelia columellifera]|uniref:Aminopeptidase N n=1 Tax=Pilimelia columellifera subsp. columellifera TaxID=706583 RepID=A0ABN3MXG1_9ACTN
MRSAFLALSAALTLTLVAPPALAADPTVGSPGVGDSYYPMYGNGGYDVAHYDVRLRYYPEDGRLTGATTILATATSNLTRFNLDFALDVTSVRVNGLPAEFTRQGGHELVITPAKALAKGQSVTIVVQYADKPATKTVDGYSAFKRTTDGFTMVGQPEAAWWWYPSNDHPTDKATFDVSVLAPEGLAALSNGVQLGDPATPIKGWKRWSWRNSQPTAPYLQFVVVGDYEITKDDINGLPVINAYHRGLGDATPAAKASIERSSEIVEWAERFYGPYPFTSLGGVAGPVDGFRNALETQGRPVYGAGFWRRGTNTSVVVHELAHQWFGDSVSVADWRNIWLNEGFATYSQWLWSEESGEGSAQELFDYTYAANPADSAFWQTKPGDPGSGDLFHTAVYNRGAMAVHQIRLAMGDEAFFPFLQEWLARNKYGVGTIARFQAHAEVNAGKSLDEVFKTWLFKPGKPELPGRTALVAPQRPKSWLEIQRAAAEAHADHDCLDHHHHHNH